MCKILDMKLSTLLGWLILQEYSIRQVAAQSTLSYDAVLTIVIIELVLSFSIGVTCILFSYNLFRAIKDSENENLEADVGSGLARRRSPYGSVDDLDNFSRSEMRGDRLLDGNIGGTRSEVRGLVGTSRVGDGGSGDGDDDDERSRSEDYHAYEDDDSELDYERNVDVDERGGGIAAVVRSFTPYLRLW